MCFLLQQLQRNLQTHKGSTLKSPRHKSVQTSLQYIVLKNFVHLHLMQATDSQQCILRKLRGLSIDTPSSQLTSPNTFYIHYHRDTSQSQGTTTGSTNATLASLELQTTPSYTHLAARWVTAHYSPQRRHCG